MKKRPVCFTPDGKFIFGIYKPSYTVTNLRVDDHVDQFGEENNGTALHNHANFPQEDVIVKEAHQIFEIPNPLPFRGATFIDKNWADSSAENSGRIRLADRQQLSMRGFLSAQNLSPDLITKLPRPLQLALATCSTDPQDLMQLAEVSCRIISDPKTQHKYLGYTEQSNGKMSAAINDHELFEAVANNPNLPDNYKTAMVLRPGAQGGSEIVGEWPADGNTHVYEYLRRNSYIAGGHYAANMAEDAVRYSIDSLKIEDIKALRHLYYQRTYIRLAKICEINLPLNRNILSAEDLEKIRIQLLKNMAAIEGKATLWGWNFGFDYSPSDYRLHASHQQIHQQYAMIEREVEFYSDSPVAAIGHHLPYSSGDMVKEVVDNYHKLYASDFFHDYFKAIYNNTRMDDRREFPSNLIIWEDKNVLLFVPKAQTSQWELQIMTKPGIDGQFPGNIVETDISCRQSLDTAIYKAQKALSRIGAKMVTSIEYSKRFSDSRQPNQALLYSLLPKLPQSMGAFSEAQLRYINGHYPEDFAAVCKEKLSEV